MTTREKIVSAAQTISIVSLFAGTIIGIIAVFQQNWPWWAGGLATCTAVFMWSFLIGASSD